MTYIIDTCSLLAFVRYYLPFDKDKKLFDTVKKSVGSKEIVVIDKVLEECRYVGGGIVVNNMPFICESNVVDTENIVALHSRCNFNLIENQFCRKTAIRNLKEESRLKYEAEKNRFVNSADLNIVLLAKKMNEGLLSGDTVVVTEETLSYNDKKYFKKIPEMCNILRIRSLFLPEFLRERYPSAAFIF